jgi:hypothetical protein
VGSLDPEAGKDTVEIHLETGPGTTRPTGPIGIRPGQDGAIPGRTPRGMIRGGGPVGLSPIPGERCSRRAGAGSGRSVRWV